MDPAMIVFVIRLGEWRFVEEVTTAVHQPEEPGQTT